MIKILNNFLVVIDMQNDFITGSLANPAAEAVIPNIKNEIEHGGYDCFLFTEAGIRVKADCCAGLTAQSHENALNAMRMCQIDII